MPGDASSHLVNGQLANAHAQLSKWPINYCMCMTCICTLSTLKKWAPHAHYTIMNSVSSNMRVKAP